MPSWRGNAYLYLEAFTKYSCTLQYLDLKDFKQSKSCAGGGGTEREKKAIFRNMLNFQENHG